VGDFIELDLQQAIQAKVVGVPVFDCHYGTSNGKYALKVNQLLTNAEQGWLGDSHVS
jgi:flagellar motor switch protein FliM